MNIASTIFTYRFLEFDCILKTQANYFFMLLGLVFLNFLLKGKLKLFIKLFIFDFFITVISYIIFDFFNPQEFVNFGNIENLSEKNYNRFTTLMLVFGIGISGYFFANYKLEKKDLILFTIVVAFFLIEFYFYPILNLATYLISIIR